MAKKKKGKKKKSKAPKVSGPEIAEVLGNYQTACRNMGCATNATVIKMLSDAGGSDGKQQTTHPPALSNKGLYTCLRVSLCARVCAYSSCAV